MARPSHAHADFPEVQRGDDARAAGLAHGHPNQPTAVAQSANDLRLDRRPRAHQQVTADARTRGHRVHRERPAPIQAVPEQESVRRQVGQQRLGLRPFRLARPPDDRRDGIVQAEFDQHSHRQLGEGRRPAATARLRALGADFARIQEIELGPVERQQPPPAPERLGVIGGASGRSTRRINSANTSHGSRVRRSDNELSASVSPNNSTKCSPNVPTSCMT